jgi:hypothetical protein
LGFFSPAEHEKREEALCGVSTLHAALSPHYFPAPRASILFSTFVSLLEDLFGVFPFPPFPALCLVLVATFFAAHFGAFSFRG